MSADERLFAAVKSMHRSKDAAYNDAWKKRGEGISVLANIARKVDRLESLAAGGPTTPDESQLDTVVDLLIYSLKYQCYLADLDDDVACALFEERVGPFSDGVAGVDVLFEDLVAGGALDSDSVEGLAREVVDLLVELEAVYNVPNSEAMVRMKVARRMANRAAALMTTVSHDYPEQRAAFVELWGGGEG